ncbi:MAG: hypothetical protein C4541_12105 [Candidatus Auribacter fodinae]|jgi:cobaltochelatase CobN|uniref:CobN/magnesium chelatase domain-containing protein n=1 Tax=Candidatus Auribacter fodinae TaxID=2093366 RepID=A0A3A4R1B0_9BACT|nr:MAG: hypothetical protein C4541_12105 [Candidatus Auribacter fodinae]
MKISNFPTREAWRLGVKAADELLSLFAKNYGRYPNRIGIILWGSEIQRTDGAGISLMSYLMGISPLWDQSGAVCGLAPLSSKNLNRPAIDTCAVISGSLRDKYPDIISLLSDAVKLTANKQLSTNAEMPVDNSNTYRRIFGPAEGLFGTGIFRDLPELYKSNQQEIRNTFIRNMRYAYSPYPEIVPETTFQQILSSIDCIIQPFTSPGYGPLTLDHTFEFSAGLKASTAHTHMSLPALFLIDFRRKNNVSVQYMLECIAMNMDDLTAPNGLFASLSKQSDETIKKTRNILVLVNAWANALPGCISSEQIHRLNRCIRDNTFLNRELYELFNVLFSQWF